LGASSYGLWVFASTIFAYLLLFNTFGLDIYGIRELSKSNDKKYILTNLLAIRLFLYISIFTVTAILGLSFVQDSRLLFLLFFALISLMFYDLTPLWFFQGSEKFGYIAFAKVAQAVVFAILISLFLDSSSVVIVGLVQSVTYGVVFFLLFLAYRRDIDISLIDTKSWKDIFGVSILLASSLFMTEIYTSMDKLMIKIWYSDSYIGYYEAAFKIYSIMLIGFSILWTVFAPRIARKNKNDFFVFTILILFFGFLFSSVLLISPELLVETIFGAEYLYATKALSVFAFIGFVVSIGFALSAPLALWGYEKVWFKSVSLAAVLNIILNLIFIPIFDIVGAAFATLVSEFVVIAFLSLKYRYIYREVFSGA